MLGRSCVSKCRSVQNVVCSSHLPKLSRASLSLSQRWEDSFTNSQKKSTYSLHTSTFPTGQQNNGWKYLAVGAAGVIGSAAWFLWHTEQHPVQCKQKKALEPGAANPKLPTFTTADVSKHNKASTGIWVGFRVRVYLYFIRRTSRVCGTDNVLVTNLISSRIYKFLIKDIDVSLSFHITRLG